MSKYLVTLEIDVHDPIELADHVVSKMSNVGKADYASDREAPTSDKTAEDLHYLFGVTYECPGVFVNLIDVVPKN